MSLCFSQPAVLNSISPDALKGDLSFLASDALQGRYSPSPGLEIAADFIASQFAAAGLVPGGNEGYFQTAAMVDRHLPKLQTGMSVQDRSQKFTVQADSITVLNVNRAAQIENAPAIVFASRDPALLKGVDLAGKAVVVTQMTRAFEKAREFDKAIGSSHAAIEILVVNRRFGQGNTRLLPADSAESARPPVILVTSDQLKNWTEHPAQTRTISVEIPAPQDQRVTLKNVIGILPGSDPKLKDTCVLLTAHYDHIGTTETAKGMAEHRSQSTTDHIYNGANDDGSGTVSVIEIARALAKLNPHPKRSIVFMTFFGEERGELGSAYYGKHPIFPIAKTVADVNLEQVGRTDSTVGSNVNTASLTGFDYSDVTKFFEDAGRETGIKVYKDPEASDAYFTRSDNDALAQQGVPAHSLTVAFDYPDYHGLGDEWQKIDYDNMARVDKMIALGLLNIANSLEAPRWNAANPKTLPFRNAQQGTKPAGST
ncbi:MAG TPA: M28 family peptidase [Bryobacteraceae bacterium]|nr:M28 family peptidase [Bryobacteraceae bacterium]